jgi:RNA polymerase sigma-70 factor (ECF subfamily)
MTKIDNSILSGLQQGNHQAFEKVFLFCYKKIRVFLLGYVKTDSDAEELTEEIFVELWQNHENIKPEKSFDSYLRTIAKNKAINFLKRKHLTFEIISNYDISDYSPSPEAEYIALEKSIFIEMIIEKMPVQMGKIYQLRQQGLTNEEIANSLKTTKRSVESQISMALKELRKALKYNILLFL